MGASRTITIEMLRSNAVKVIFNLQSGREEESPQQLVRILTCLQDQHMVPEVHLVQPEDNLSSIAAEAASSGFELVIACGGDGTVSRVASGLINTPARLGIIPTGTQNNQAFALGIPLNNLEAAVQFLRQADTVLIDTGLIHCKSGQQHPFIEVASIGLTSALFTSTDEIQHGDLTKIGEFMRILLSHPLTLIEADLNNGERQVSVEAHTVLITNMPYTGARWRMSEDVSFDDGLLDIFFFPEMSKIDLINTVLQVSAGPPEDERIWHYQVRNAQFHCHLPSPVMVDGAVLGECDFTVEVQPRSLSVMANAAVARV
jgi:diacylglycerol kinase (ATP)